MQIRMPAVLIAMPVILTGCAGIGEAKLTWEADLPSQQYFLDAYDRDPTNAKNQSLDQYITWVTRFYQGWELYPEGWHIITRNIIVSIKQQELLPEIQDKMQRLGLLISAEWAKDNQSRQINTRHVSIWGNALLKSLEHGETLSMLNRITTVVEDLLAKRISATVITENRFYAEEDIFKEVN